VGHVAKDDDEIIVPKKSKTKPVSGRGGASSGTPGVVSPQMRRLMRITSGVGIALGGFVALVGMMAVVGLVTDNLWARLGVGVVVVVGLPSFLADRMLKRGGSTLATRGGLGLVADVFAIVLLGVALILVSADAITRGLLRHEGDIYARAGSTTMARLVYFVAGVSPVFPFEKAALKPAGSASASASGAAPAPPR
jgi:hypothetical protein